MFSFRVFYESLLKQRPDSEMAQEWCVTYGILEEAEAAVLYKKICNRKGLKPAVLSPMKPVKKESTVKKEASSTSASSGRKKSVKV